MMEAQRNLHLHMVEITRLELYKNRQKIFQQGDKSGRFLAMLAQQEHSATLISEIRTQEGVTVSNPEDILEAFGGYYISLYASSLPSDLHPREMSDLLD